MRAMETKSHEEVQNFIKIMEAISSVNLDPDHYAIIWTRCDKKN